MGKLEGPANRLVNQDRDIYERERVRREKLMGGSLSGPCPYLFSNLSFGRFCSFKPHDVLASNSRVLGMFGANPSMPLARVVGPHPGRTIRFFLYYLHHLGLSHALEGVRLARLVEHLVVHAQISPSDSPVVLWKHGLGLPCLQRLSGTP